MKYVDTPPILAILLWKQKTPPTFEWNSKIQKLVEFYIHSPKIGENGLHPLKKELYIYTPSGYFWHFP